MKRDGFVSIATLVELFTKVFDSGTCNEVVNRFSGQRRAGTIQYRFAFGVGSKYPALMIEFEIRNRRSFVEELIFSFGRQKRLRVFLQSADRLDECFPIQLNRRTAHIRHNLSSNLRSPLIPRYPDKSVPPLTFFPGYSGICLIAVWADSDQPAKRSVKWQPWDNDCC